MFVTQHYKRACSMAAEYSASTLGTSTAASIDRHVGFPSLLKLFETPKPGYKRTFFTNKWGPLSLVHVHMSMNNE